jgi:hypothetical protein
MDHIERRRGVETLKFKYIRNFQLRYNYRPMNKIRQSYDGIKNMVTNVIAFVAGNNDSDSSLSSAEVVECGSDCS